MTVNKIPTQAALSNGSSWNHPGIPTQSPINSALLQETDFYRISQPDSDQLTSTQTKSDSASGLENRRVHQLPIDSEGEPAAPGFGDAVAGEFTAYRSYKLVHSIWLACKYFIFPLTIGSLLGVTAIYLGSSLLIAGVIASASAVAINCFFLISNALAHKTNSNSPSRSVQTEDIPLSAPKLGESTTASLWVENDPQIIFQTKLNLVKTATQSIEWSFNFAGGERFQEALSTISERMSSDEGAEIRTHLIMSPDFLTKENRKTLENLKRKFPGRFHFIITPRVTMTDQFIRTEENHVKLLVVDNHLFNLGGTGVTDQMCRASSDTSDHPPNEPLMTKLFIDPAFHDSDAFGVAQTSDNIAETLRIQFFNLYRQWSQRINNTLSNNEGAFFPVAPQDPIDPKTLCIQGNVRTVKLKALVCGPEHRNSNPIENEIINRFKGAESTIRIAHMIFNPSAKIKKTLQQKNLKAKIELITNGTPGGSTDRHQILAFPSRFHYPLVDKVHEVQTKDRLYHRKVIVIDKKLTIIGSYNIGQKSAYCDTEMVLCIDSEEIASELIEITDKDKTLGTEINEKQPEFHSLKFMRKIACVLTGPTIN